MKFSLVFTLDFRVSDKNVPFTQSLHHKLFTLVYSMPAILILACLDYHHYIVIVLRNTFAGVYCNLLYTTKTTLEIIRL